MSPETETNEGGSWVTFHENAKQTKWKTDSLEWKSFVSKSYVDRYARRQIMFEQNDLTSE